MKQFKHRLRENSSTSVEAQVLLPWSSYHNSLSRLVGEIREKGDLSSGTMLSRIWDASLPENEEEQFRNDLRAASGIGKSKGKGTVSFLFPSFILSFLLMIGIIEESP